MARARSTTEAKWSAATRKAYYAAHPENFAGPEASYPIKDASDVGDAWNLAGHADDPDAVRARIEAIAKRLGLTHGLPDTANDEEKEAASGTKESQQAMPFRPTGKIATLTTCWLEDDAVSLNGRKYPREAVDRLIQSAQTQLSTPGAPPLTCYISHTAADEDDSLKLVGKITTVWREGVRAMASIDLANTSAGRDAATLATDGYLITQSLRASNAEIHRSPDSTWPLVGGSSLRLDGIDFTSTPGIQAARIQAVALAESSSEDGPQKLHEIFKVRPKDFRLEALEATQEDAVLMTKKLTEVAGGNMPLSYDPTSGNTVGVTGDPTQDAYAQRMYQQPPDTSGGNMQGMEQAPELMEAHDRVAMVQNRSCAPGRESARWQAAFATLSEKERRLVEAGRSLSAANDAHLDAAHHAIAKHLGMECEGVNNKMTTGERYDPDHDGDDDSTADRTKNPDFGLDQMDGVTPQSRESAPRLPQPPRIPITPPTKGQIPMSMAEARRLLEQSGWTTDAAGNLVRPKTETEKLQESIREALKAELQAVQEAHTAEIAELRAQLTQRQTPAAPAAPFASSGEQPQRKSMVNGATNQQHPNSIRSTLYSRGKYLRERLNNLDWQQLADRTAPIPDDLNLDWLLKEFEQLYAVQYDDRFHVLSAELR